MEDWARRMRGEAHGDEVCIEYFARHFRVNIRVHTPLCDSGKPLQFPMYLDQGETFARPVVDKSIYRIAHLPVQPHSDVRHHYVPVWAGGIEFTPLSTPVHGYEIDSDSPMKSLQKKLEPEREKRRETAGQRMASSATPQGIAEVRKQQVFSKYWTVGWSKTQHREFYTHKLSHEKVWPEDYDAVCKDKHPEVKIPPHMPR